MTVKEFLLNTKLHGNVDIMEVKYDEANPNCSDFFVGVNPYKIDNVQNFDFKYYYVRHELLRKYSNMEIISMSCSNCDGRCALNIGCMSR